MICRGTIKAAVRAMASCHTGDMLVVVAVAAEMDEAASAAEMDEAASRRP
jgi:hypothetical protein